MWLTPVENAVAFALSVLATLIGALVLTIGAWVGWSGLAILLEPALAKAFRSAQVQLGVIPSDVSDPAIAALIGLHVQDALHIAVRSGFECRVDGSGHDCERAVNWIVCGEEWRLRMEAPGGLVLTAQGRKTAVCL